MSSLNGGNSSAVYYLIELEKSMENKTGYSYRALIEALGEAGGREAVYHLIELAKSKENKNSETYRIIIQSIGKAGRVV